MIRAYPLPFVTLNDLSNEPIRQTIDLFKDFSSSFPFNPFKLITYKNSVLVNRCKIAAFPDPLVDDNCFLSILLVKRAEDPAFRQSLFALRVFLGLAEDRNVDVATLAEFDRARIGDILGIDQSKWRFFSLMMLKPPIRITPRELLDTSLGVN